jgi:hypothetical protein
MVSGDSIGAELVSLQVVAHAGNQLTEASLTIEYNKPSHPENHSLLPWRASRRVAGYP